MRLLDLTHLISEDMPVYPGTEKPKLHTAYTVEMDGFQETFLSMYSHTGTHLDAPAHLYAAAPTLDQLDINNFCGPALVIDCTEFKNTPGAVITMKYLRAQAEQVAQADFILFNTGWSDYWFEDKYYGDFPVVDHEVARFLATGRKKGIGVDVISIDPLTREDLPAHQIVLSAGLIIIENLTNLDQVGSGLFTLCAFPLKYSNADGAPVRAVALLPEQRGP
jgi:Predicted metal-dependent hydrolase